MSATIVEQLNILIAEELDVNIKLEDIDPNISLFEDGLELDSLSIVEFISLIEDYFDFRFSDDDISPQNFANLIILSDLITKKIQSKKEQVAIS